MGVGYSLDAFSLGGSSMYKKHFIPWKTDGNYLAVIIEYPFYGYYQYLLYGFFSFKIT